MEDGCAIFGSHLVAHNNRIMLTHDSAMFMNIPTMFIFIHPKFLESSECSQYFCNISTMFSLCQHNNSHGFAMFS